MGEAANVRAIRTLGDLSLALGKFKGETQDALKSAGIEIRQTLEWLQSRVQYWRRQVELWEEEVDRLRQDLARCREDEDNDCGGYEEEVAEARRRLQDAHENLQIAHQWMRRVETVAQQYHIKARRLYQLTTNHTDAARTILAGKRAELERYAIMASSGAGETLSSNSSRVSGSTTSSSKKWVELGMVDVSLDAIDLSDSWVKGTGDFHKVPYGTMVEGVRNFKGIVQPAVKQGANGDYFSEMDRRAGLDYEHGYRRLYDAFYGSEPIRLNKMGDRYTVTGGYHRLMVARELGLETIPASVVERNPLVED